MNRYIEKSIYGLLFGGSIYSSYRYGKNHTEKLEKEHRDYIHSYIRFDVCNHYHTCRETKDTMECYEENIKRIDSFDIHHIIKKESLLHPGTQRETAILGKGFHHPECKREYEEFQKAQKDYQDKKYYPHTLYPIF